MGIGPMVLCGDSVRIWPLYPELRDLYHLSVSGFQSVVGWTNVCLNHQGACLKCSSKSIGMEPRNLHFKQVL